MDKLLFGRMIVTVAASLFLVFQIHAAETKKVCHAEKDRKGKETQVCKTIKVHKKLDGTKVPPK
jgi:hypothetical protein